MGVFGKGCNSTLRTWIRTWNRRCARLSIDNTRMLVRLAPQPLLQQLLRIIITGALVFRCNTKSCILLQRNTSAPVIQMLMAYSHARLDPVYQMGTSAGRAPRSARQRSASTILYRPRHLGWMALLGTELTRCSIHTIVKLSILSYTRVIITSAL